MFSESVFFQPPPYFISPHSLPVSWWKILSTFYRRGNWSLKDNRQVPRVNHFVWYPRTQSPGTVCSTVLSDPTSWCSLASEMKTWRSHALLGHHQEHLGHIFDSSPLTVQNSGFPQGMILRPPPSSQGDIWQCPETNGRGGATGI